MSQPPLQSSETPQTQGDHFVRAKSTRGLAIFFSLLGIVSAGAGFRFARHGAARESNPGTPVAAPGISSMAQQRPDPAKAEADELSELPPQQQAERLLERAIHHQESSINLIREEADSWRGRLRGTDELCDLVHQALNSEDLRVRGAAIEVDLAASNLSKTPQSVARLLEEIRKQPGERPLALWRLGALGNRGVEPKMVLGQLLKYTHATQEDTRDWAVEGLAILGGSDSIDPLLDRFAHDSSARVRQHAGLALAQSGMLTPEQRLGVVPDLFNMLDDDALGKDTRGWVYGALRLITGAAIGNDTQAWLKWWAHHDASRRRDSYSDDVSRA
jgi:HEAT repeat protein